MKRRLPLMLPLLIACRIVTAPEMAAHDDPDGDGYAISIDCAEFDATISPGLDEKPYDGRDNDCDSSTADDDLDEDGHPIADDCNDTRADISPDALEICDGVDNDCDDETDEDGGEGVRTWYADTDGDQHGDADSAIQSCGSPTGYVTSSNDCDDGSETVSPSATERCDGLDNDCDDEVDEDAADAQTWYQDEDDDGFGQDTSTTTRCEVPAGYVAEGGDCDDHDADVSPDKDEICDGWDQDCDGNTDETAMDAAVWYADEDADGVGDPDRVQIACEAPAGFVAEPGDCDDNNVNVLPGADERCNTVDDDCDEEIDESSAIDTVSWYADTDADGFGDATAATSTCEVPAAYVADATDCDDANAAINPDATENPGDEIDQDCDGVELCFVDIDNDKVASAGDVTLSSADTDCDDAGEREVEGADCDDEDATVYVGAPTICDDGRANDCESTDEAEHMICRVEAPETIWTLSEPDEDANVGAAMASLADLNDDGADEIIIGAYNASNGDIDPGAIWLIGGGRAGTTEILELSSIAAATWAGDADNDQLGRSLGSVDLDGDDLEELLVGAPYANGGGLTDAGELLAFDGAELALALDGAGDLTPLASWHADTSDSSGYAIATPTAVGEAWLLVGVPFSGGSLNSGDARVLSLNADGELATELTVSGADRSGYAGRSLVVGDLDADGQDELIIAAPRPPSSTSYGAAQVFALGMPTGDALLSAAEWSWTAETVGDQAGSALVLCDLDASGSNELLIGAPYAEDQAGAVRFAFDPALGSASLSALPSINGATERDQLGGALTCADLDGDGTPDLILGAPYVDVGFEENAGEIYVFYGPLSTGTAPSTADLTVPGSHSGQNLGASLAAVSDQDGDERMDLLVGAPGAANDLSGEVIFDAGAVQLISVRVE